MREQNLEIQTLAGIGQYSLEKSDKIFNEYNVAFTYTIIDFSKKSKRMCVFDDIQYIQEKKISPTKFSHLPTKMRNMAVQLLQKKKNDIKKQQSPH